MADLSSTRVFGKLTVMHKAILKANAEIVGNVTANKFYGDGSNLTGNSGMRARGTTKSDVGLGNLPNSLTSSRDTNSNSVLATASGIYNHKRSGDHDGRYPRLYGAHTADFDRMPRVGGSPIVESGSNSVGRWTKWASGYGICSAVGNQATSKNQHTLPINFKRDTWHVVISPVSRASSSNEASYVTEGGPISSSVQATYLVKSLLHTNTVIYNPTATHYFTVMAHGQTI